MLQPMISMRIIGSESIDGQLVRSSFDTASPDRLRQRPFRPETVRSCCRLQEVEDGSRALRINFVSFGCHDPLHDEGVGRDTRVIRITTFPMSEYRASHGGLERADAKNTPSAKPCAIQSLCAGMKSGAPVRFSANLKKVTNIDAPYLDCDASVKLLRLWRLLTSWIGSSERRDLELPSAKLPKASALLLSGRTQQLDVLRRPLFRWTETADHRLRRDSVQQ